MISNKGHPLSFSFTEERFCSQFGIATKKHARALINEKTQFSQIRMKSNAKIVLKFFNKTAKEEEAKFLSKRYV